MSGKIHITTTYAIEGLTGTQLGTLYDLLDHIPRNSPDEMANALVELLTRRCREMIEGGYVS